MAASETVSLALSGVFGVVSSIGVIYQVIDIRKRSRVSTETGPTVAAAGTVPAPYPVPSVPPVTTWPPPPAGGPGPYPQPQHPPRPAPGSYPEAGRSVVQPPTVPPPQGTYRIPPQSPPPGQAAPVVGVPWPAAWPPRIPRAIVRARVLLLILSVFTAVSVALILYTSQVEYGGTTSEDTPIGIALAARAVVFLVCATPLSLVPMAMSLLIGRGLSWARVTAIVVLFVQAAFCSCFGAILPFLPAATGPDATGEKAVVGDAALGVLGILIGIASVLAAIMLLTKESGGYFRAMSQWRSVSAAR